jgi:hypothetical protein
MADSRPPKYESITVGEMMPRHVMTPAERLRGIRKAIRTLRSRRGGPKWLLPGLQKYEKKLAREVRDAKAET